MDGVLWAQRLVGQSGQAGEVASNNDLIIQICLDTFCFAFVISSNNRGLSDRARSPERF